MRPAPWLPAGLTAILIGLTTMAPGCSKRTEEDDNPSPRPTKGTTAAERKPFKGTYDGTIKGQVVFVGERPNYAWLPDLKANKDCHSPDPEQNADQKWLVDANGGVADVVVWLAPPKGTYFDLPEELRTRKEPAVVDQPYCAFVPHVQVAFPKYFDGKEFKPTGEDFVVKNSAKIQHNTKWNGDPVKNPGGNPTLAPGESKTFPINPNDLIQLRCNIHSWMGGHLHAFEHPFFARTGKDGTFEIKNVPTGVDLQVVGWHEGAGYFNGGKAGTKTNFKPGENTLKFEVKK
ncbi:MAG: hypothetical protein HY040_14340 [Planctomycetes bacterium]|nr:hypothetical protein [Planctomycetota bacterium]